VKSSRQERVEGMFHEAKGWCREVAGKFTHNSKMEAEGMVEQVAGIVQGKIGQYKKTLRA
jgi:uncharacterized protein YjbJ (UPF0337 family)